MSDQLLPPAEAALIQEHPLASKNGYPKWSPCHAVPPLLPFNLSRAVQRAISTIRVYLHDIWKLWSITKATAKSLLPNRAPETGPPRERTCAGPSRLHLEVAQVTGGVRGPARAMGTGVRSIEVTRARTSRAAAGRVPFRVRDRVVPVSEEEKEGRTRGIVRSIKVRLKI